MFLFFASKNASRNRWIPMTDGDNCWDVCLVIVEVLIIVFLGIFVDPPVEDAFCGLFVGISVDDPPVDDDAGCGGVFSGSFRPSFFNAWR